MSGSFVPIASSLERASLERLEKYLARHGIECCVIPVAVNSERFALSVAKAEAGRAQRVLEEIALPGGDMLSAEEVVEIRCNENESTEIATWLQLLLDEQDEEGSPIFFYRPYYEALLDGLHAQDQVEAPVFLLRGLKPFLPSGPKRVVMSLALREFFDLIEALSADGAAGEETRENPAFP
jgi:hypothetical protein